MPWNGPLPVLAAKFRCSVVWAGRVAPPESAIAPTASRTHYNGTIAGAGSRVRPTRQAAHSNGSMMKDDGDQREDRAGGRARKDSRQDRLKLAPVSYTH